MPPLTRLALNRALLSRQHLMERSEGAALDVVRRVVGLQAQQPRPPFVGLWSRVEGFAQKDLLELLRNRKAVRATMLRGTLHIVAAEDYATHRATIQPALALGLKVLGERLAGLDVPVITAAARPLYTEPKTFEEIRTALLEIFPGADERAMGYIARTQLPLVVVPDESRWGFPPDPRFTLAETWLDEPLGVEERTADLVLRYLAAFGPATAADMQSWSALQGLKPVFESLRPQLEVSRDERKRELFDLPGAPRPEEETPVPVRYLAGFDNAILGHADRSRIIADEYRPRVTTKNLQVLPTFLVDGFVAGTWTVSRVKAKAILTLSPFCSLEKPSREALVEEGEKLARFLEPDAGELSVSFEAQ